MKRRNIITRQYNIPFIGAVKITFNSAATYFSMLSWLNIAVVAYSTTWRDWFALHAQWISLPVYIIIQVIIAPLLILLVEYKFGLASQFDFTSNQSWEHNNPLRKHLETKTASKEDLRKLEENIKDIKKLMNK